MQAFFNYSAQRGIVLIVGLIFLMILTIVGITSMTSSSISEKLTQNMFDSSVSFDAAEASLGDGETWVRSQTSVPVAVSTCSSAPCRVWKTNTLSNINQQPDSWWQTTAVPFSSTIGNVALQPAYVIEQFSFIPYDLSPDALSKGHGYYYYRVTAKGTGSTNTARSIVQSIFATQFN